MVPSGASASVLTELMLGSCSKRTLTARESFNSPKLEATTFSRVPVLKSVSLVCVQKLVLTAQAEAATKNVARIAKNRIGNSSCCAGRREPLIANDGEEI